MTEPTPTFSTCFGAPFMPRRPEVYGTILRDRDRGERVDLLAREHGVDRGAYGTGRRMPIAATRALLAAALDGSLGTVEFRRDPNFGFDVPVTAPGVDDTLLDPRRTWADAAAYDGQAAVLMRMFAENFERYLPFVDADVKAAAIG